MAVALAVLFDAMPYPRSMEPDKAKNAYYGALQGISIAAIQAGIAKFLRGECDHVSQKYAPMPPELARICRTAVVPHRIPEKRQLAPPARPWNWKAPFEIRQEKARICFAGWTPLAKNIGYLEFRAMSQKGAVPVGAVWSATLGTIFLPPPGHPIGQGPGEPERQKQLDFSADDLARLG